MTDSYLPSVGVMNPPPIPIGPLLVGLGAVLMFPAIWLLVLALIARLSGWSAVAAAYRADDDNVLRAEVVKTWQSALLRRGARYNNCLTFQADADGLAVRMQWLFRWSHATLWIPWEDIEALRESTSATTLRFSQAPEVRMRISTALHEELAAARRSDR